jgi:hypothetical protein
MINELDQIVLTTDVEGTRFKAGDVGVVVHIYESGQHFEVEFFSLGGDTLDVVTVPASSARPIQATEVVHARSLA